MPVTDPLWAAEADAPRTRRPLSRQGIVAAAIALADAEGIDAVSMPRLGRTLDAAPMSLYRHVPNKDALVDLMLDTAIGSPPAGEDGEGWRAALGAWAHANRAVFARHPWTLPLVTGPRPMGPNACAWGEAALRIAVDAGLPHTEAARVLGLVNGYVLGACAVLAPRAPSPATLDASGRAGEFPLLEPLLRAAADDTTGAMDDGDFTFGLDRVLDGIEQYVTRRP